MAVAILFTGLLNAALLGGAFRPAWWSLHAEFVLCGVVCIFWVVAIRRNWKTLPEFWQPNAKESVILDELFQQAQNEYLRGHWLEAELEWRQVLERHPGDVESRLMLASLYRRTSRCEEALRELKHLANFEAAAKLGLEICRERKLIEDRLALCEANPVAEKQQTSDASAPHISEAA